MPGGVSKAMESVCEVLHPLFKGTFQLPQELNLSPLNCPLLLGYWKVALHVVSQLKLQERLAFQEFESGIGPAHSQCLMPGPSKLQDISSQQHHHVR